MDYIEPPRDVNNDDGSNNDSSNDYGSNNDSINNYVSYDRYGIYDINVLPANSTSGGTMLQIRLLFAAIILVIGFMAVF